MNIANPHTKKYYLSHREEIAEAQRNYQIRNPDVFKANNKRYREKKKDTLIQCPCGSEISLMCKYDHFKTKKHIDFLAGKIPLDATQLQAQQKEKRRAYYREQISCECGINCRRDNMKHHVLSKCHLAFQAENQPIGIAEIVP